MNSKLTVDDLTRELRNLKTRYKDTLDQMAERVGDARRKFNTPEGGDLGGVVGTHDAFNMGATASELATLAGKIEQTQNVIRWMAGN